jgi:hypothetical protein
VFAHGKLSQPHLILADESSLHIVYTTLLSNIRLSSKCSKSSKFVYRGTFFIEKDADIVPSHYTWKVAFTNLIHKQRIQVKLLNEGAHYTRMCTTLEKFGT